MAKTRMRTSCSRPPVSRCIAPKPMGAGHIEYSIRRWMLRPRRRCASRSDIREALARGDFELYYQPIVSSETGQVTTCEALLRWKHPERGWISPAVFIPVAENTGLIVQLGEWALRKACAQASRGRLRQGSGKSSSGSIPERQAGRAPCSARLPVPASTPPGWSWRSPSRCCWEATIAMR